jgi:hypothetical protein
MDIKIIYPILSDRTAQSRIHNTNPGKFFLLGRDFYYYLSIQNINQLARIVASIN